MSIRRFEKVNKVNGEKSIFKVKGYELVSFEEDPKGVGAIKQEYRDIMEALKKAISENLDVHYYEVRPLEGKSLKNSGATFKKEKRPAPR